MMNPARALVVLAFILSSLQDAVFPHRLIPDILSKRSHLSSRNFKLLDAALDIGDYSQLTKANIYSHLPVNLSPTGSRISYEILHELEFSDSEEHYRYVKDIEVTEDALYYYPHAGDDVVEPQQVIQALQGVIYEGFYSLDNLESIRSGF